MELIFLWVCLSLMSRLRTDVEGGFALHHYEGGLRKPSIRDHQPCSTPRATVHTTRRVPHLPICLLCTLHRTRCVWGGGIPSLIPARYFIYTEFCIC